MPTAVDATDHSGGRPAAGHTGSGATAPMGSFASEDWQFPAKSRYADEHRSGQTPAVTVAQTKGMSRIGVAVEGLDNLGLTAENETLSDGVRGVMRIGLLGAVLRTVTLCNVHRSAWSVRQSN